jgi:hypothetical protein
LETGGKIWGWLGIICGVLSLLINSVAAYRYFAHRNFDNFSLTELKLIEVFAVDAMESYEIFISILSFITIIVSVTLLIGIKRVNRPVSFGS